MADVNLDAHADDAAHPRLSAELTTLMTQLFSAGFSLLPLGGSNGKKPIVEFKGRKRLPLGVIVNRMAAGGSLTYGIRLDGLLVIDVDTDAPEARAYVEHRFAASGARTRTKRGFHLYYQFIDGKPPKAVRLPNIAIDFKTGRNSVNSGAQTTRASPCRGRSSTTCWPKATSSLCRCVCFWNPTTDTKGMSVLRSFPMPLSYRAP